MRFVIKSPQGGYLSDFVVTQTRAVTLNGVFVGTESDSTPVFEALKPKQALKFDTEADANAQISNANPLHGGPEAFKGCTVESTQD